MGTPYVFKGWGIIYNFKSAIFTAKKIQLHTLIPIYTWVKGVGDLF